MTRRACMGIVVYIKQTFIRFKHRPTSPAGPDGSAARQVSDDPSASRRAWIRYVLIAVWP